MNVDTQLVDWLEGSTSFQELIDLQLLPLLDPTSELLVTVQGPSQLIVLMVNQSLHPIVFGEVDFNHFLECGFLYSTHEAGRFIHYRLTDPGTQYLMWLATQDRVEGDQDAN